MRLKPTTSSFINEHSNIWPNWSNDWAKLWVLFFTVHLTVCSYHDRYAFQSESTLFSCVDVKELLAWRRCEIWSLRDCNETQTHNQTNTQLFSQTGQMIELCYEYLSLWCIWLYVLILSRMRFRVNSHSIVAWFSRNSLLENRCRIWSLSDCNGTWTHNDLVHKRTLNHLAKLAK